MDINYLTSRECKAYLQKGGDLVFVPLGRTERLGPHMPLGARNIVVNAVAQLMAEKNDGLMLPLIPYSTVYDAFDQRGSIDVTPGFMHEYCINLCDELVANGFNRIVFISFQEELYYLSHDYFQERNKAVIFMNPYSFVDMTYGAPVSATALSMDAHGGELWLLAACLHATQNTEMLKKVFAKVEEYFDIVPVVNPGRQGLDLLGKSGYKMQDGQWQVYPVNLGCSLGNSERFEQPSDAMLDKAKGELLNWLDSLAPVVTDIAAYQKYLDTLVQPSASSRSPQRSEEAEAGFIPAVAAGFGAESHSCQYMFPDELDRYIEGDGQKIAVIPIGSVEQHGPHLLLGTDGFITFALSKLTAEKLGGVLMPMLPFSWIGGLRPFAGTIDMRPFTTAEYMEQVSVSVLNQGFDKLVLVNCHGGGREMVYSVARRVFKKTGKPVITEYPSRFYDAWPEIMDIWAKEGIGRDWACFEASKLLGALEYMGEHEAAQKVRQNTIDAVAEFGEDVQMPSVPGLSSIQQNMGEVGHDYNHECMHVRPRAKFSAKAGIESLDFMAEKFAEVIRNA